MREHGSQLNHPPVFDGFHVAIVMDGNGRWATSRGRPRACY